MTLTDVGGLRDGRYGTFISQQVLIPQVSIYVILCPHSHIHILQY